jgi:hypothetical protein
LQITSDTLHPWPDASWRAVGGLVAPECSPDLTAIFAKNFGSRKPYNRSVSGSEIPLLLNEIKKQRMIRTWQQKPNK